MRVPQIEEKVDFLRRADVYPEPTGRVDVKETHMSWVFLTDNHAYKLKKPVRSAFLDYSTPEARRRTCEAEVKLNRRLAANVYCGIVPLTLTVGGAMRLGGEGEAIDWLVKMWRLPESRMLDHAIAAKTVAKDDARRVGALLAHFYSTAPVAAMSRAEYRRQMAAEIRNNYQELSRPELSLPGEWLDATTTAQWNMLQNEPGLFDERVAAQRIVEAHGDLRPEHICLGPPPVVIDCLEFSRALRVLDAASEIAFLWLECERLGAPEVGRMIFASYCDGSGDRPPAALMKFYVSYHACVRAKVAVWHLNDHQIDHPAKWIEKAGHYLRLAAASLANAPLSGAGLQRGER